MKTNPPFRHLPIINLNDPNIPHIKRMDRAEIEVEGHLYRYSDWNEDICQFNKVEVITNTEYSLANSLIFDYLFTISGLRFYRMKPGRCD